MNSSPKTPGVIKISLSSPNTNNLSIIQPKLPSIKSTVKKTFNPFIKPPQVSEISLYESTRPDDSSKKESNYDEIILNLEHKFEGLLLENRQLTEEMNSLSLSDQSSLDYRNVEFVSLESLPYHKETYSIDLQDGFVLQKAIEEKAKMEASLIQTVYELKKEKTRLKGELSVKKQEAFHLEKCIKTHNDKKVYEISLRNDENSWKRKYYELQKVMDKRNKEFEEIERSYQLKIKECYNEMERLRNERKGETFGGCFNDVERKLSTFDERIMELMEYIKELEYRLKEKEGRR